jgi:hypothetical protein
MGCVGRDLVAGVWDNEAAERATNSPGCDTPLAAKPRGGADLMVAHTQNPVQTARRWI